MKTIGMKISIAALLLFSVAGCTIQTVDGGHWADTHNTDERRPEVEGNGSGDFTRRTPKLGNNRLRDNSAPNPRARDYNRRTPRLGNNRIKPRKRPVIDFPSQDGARPVIQFPNQ